MKLCSIIFECNSNFGLNREMRVCPLHSMFSSASCKMKPLAIGNRTGSLSGQADTCADTLDNEP